MLLFFKAAYVWYSTCYKSNDTQVVGCALCSEIQLFYFCTIPYFVFEHIQFLLFFKMENNQSLDIVWLKQVQRILPQATIRKKSVAGTNWFKMQCRRSCKDPNCLWKLVWKNAFSTLCTLNETAFTLWLSPALPFSLTHIISFPFQFSSHWMRQIPTFFECTNQMAIKRLKSCLYCGVIYFISLLPVSCWSLALGE